MVLSFSDLPESPFSSPPATPTLTADPRPLNTSSPDWPVGDGAAERPIITNTTPEGAGEEEEGGPGPDGGGSDGGTEPSKDTGEMWGISKYRGGHRRLLAVDAVDTEKL